MEKYEITYATSTAGKVESVEAAITELGGSVIESTDLGIKSFAFPVQKLTEARFVSVIFHIEKENVNTLEKKVGQEKSIIRFILISALRAKKEIKKRKGDKAPVVTEKVATATEPKPEPAIKTEPEAKPEEKPAPDKEKPVTTEPTVEKKTAKTAVKKTSAPKARKVTTAEPKPEPKAKIETEEEPSSSVELDEKLKELVED